MSTIARVAHLHRLDSEISKGKLGVPPDRNDYPRVERLKEPREQGSASIALKASMAAIGLWVTGFMRVERKYVPEEYGALNAV